MPLLVVTGFPSSGKSSLVGRFCEHLRGLSVPFSVVSEEALSLSRATTYSHPRQEKITRAALKSAAERALGQPGHVVVLDSVNFIKGYRYELWCVARALQTPRATLFVSTSAEDCKLWNASKPEGAERYSEACMEDLIGRFESPNDRDKWDRPCFVWREGDPEAQLFEEIAAFLVPPSRSGGGPSAALPSPSFATEKRPLAQAGLLHEVDSELSRVLSSIVAAQAESPGAPQIVIPGCRSRLLLQRLVTLPELRRIKDAFLKLIRLRGAEDVNKESVAETFVTHLNSVLK
jgi:protein KTI12